MALFKAETYNEYRCDDTPFTEELEMRATRYGPSNSGMGNVGFGCVIDEQPCQDFASSIYATRVFQHWEHRIKGDAEK